MINTYAQDLGVQSREFSGIGFIRRDLACSDWRPGQWKKHQDNILTKIVAKLDVLVEV
jgi:hypothetical protein